MMKLSTLVQIITFAIFVIFPYKFTVLSNSIIERGKENAISFDLTANNVPLKFYLSDNLPTEFSSMLKRWTASLKQTMGSVSYKDASDREQIVVSKVNSGVWDIRAYHEYQRISALTGNVDSARLLVDYGITWSISEILKSPSTGSSVERQVYLSLIKCDLNQFKKILFDDNGGSIFAIDSRLSQGSTCLMIATYSGCQSIVTFLLQLVTSPDNSDYIDQFGSHGMTSAMIAASRFHL